MRIRPSLNMVKLSNQPSKHLAKEREMAIEMTTILMFTGSMKEDICSSIVIDMY